MSEGLIIVGILVVIFIMGFTLGALFGWRLCEGEEKRFQDDCRADPGYQRWLEQEAAWDAMVRRAEDDGLLHINEDPGHEG